MHFNTPSFHSFLVVLVVQVDLQVPSHLLLPLHTNNTITTSQTFHPHLQHSQPACLVDPLDLPLHFHPSQQIHSLTNTSSSSPKASTFKPEPPAIPGAPCSPTGPYTIQITSSHYYQQFTLNNNVLTTQRQSQLCSSSYNISHFNCPITNNTAITTPIYCTDYRQ